MRRGRKPRPDRDAVNLPGKALPRCPGHLDEAARNEWRRLAKPMHDAGVLTIADRGALAAYCQAWSRWVQAEEKLKATPILLKTPSGYVQQSPWLSISNKQLEIMGRYMAELGLTPSARSRLGTTTPAPDGTPATITRIILEAPDPQRQIEGTTRTLEEAASHARVSSGSGQRGK